MEPRHHRRGSCQHESHRISSLQEKKALVLALARTQRGPLLFCRSKAINVVIVMVGASWGLFLSTPLLPRARVSSSVPTSGAAATRHLLTTRPTIVKNEPRLASEITHKERGGALRARAPTGSEEREYRGFLVQKQKKEKGSYTGR